MRQMNTTTPTSWTWEEFANVLLRAGVDAAQRILEGLHEHGGDRHENELSPQDHEAHASAAMIDGHIWRLAEARARAHGEIAANDDDWLRMYAMIALAKDTLESQSRGIIKTAEEERATLNDGI